MTILLIAATDAEIRPTLDWLEINQMATGNYRIETCITGVGLLQTTYALTLSLHHFKPGLLVQAGIAGCFGAAAKPGEVFVVSEEILADTGVEEEGEWKDFFDMGLSDPNAFPFKQKLLINPCRSLLSVPDCKIARSISINTITTGESGIRKMTQHYQPLLESMEGAALHYVGLREKIPFIQFRSVSNRVGERDKKKWKMNEAIAHLNDTLIRFLCNPKLVNEVTR